MKVNLFNCGEQTVAYTFIHVSFIRSNEPGDLNKKANIHSLVFVFLINSS